MTKTDQLEEVLLTEAELTEALLDTLRQQQDSVVLLKAEALQELVVRVQELTKPLAELERQRLKLMEELSTNGKVTTLRELVKSMTEADGKRLLRLGTRLQKAINDVRNVNAQNRALLEHSLRFVKENVRILTDNYHRQLIDQRM